MAKQDKGWYPDAIKIPIPIFPEENYRGGYGDVPAGQMEAKAVVHHIISGYVTTLNQWMSSGDGPQISCHFGIGRDGTVYQYASIFDATWHAGDVEANPQWKLYDSKNPNKVTVGIECEGFSTKVSYGDYVYDSSTPFPEPMVKSLVAVTRWSLEQHNIQANEDTVIGHFMLNSLNRAHDPGSAWPIQRILDEIRGYKQTDFKETLSQKDVSNDPKLEIALAHLRDAIDLIESVRADKN